MSARHLVLGLDGADLGIVRELGAERLPTLHAHMQRGAFAALESVLPPATLPNWTTFLKNTEGYRRDLRRADYGDERDPKMAAVFDKISPLNMSDRMKKPMMIYQGANDPRVPQSESEQMVAKLRAQGAEVWYVLAKDEGHGVHKKQNAEAVRATEIVFLQKVLGTK